MCARRPIRLKPILVSIARTTWEYSNSTYLGCQSITGLPPSINCSGTHLNTWVVETGSVRVKSLSQEHHTMSQLARARARTAQSGDKCTNHEATAPPTMQFMKGLFLFENSQLNGSKKRWMGGKGDSELNNPPQEGYGYFLDQNINIKPAVSLQLSRTEYLPSGSKERSLHFLLDVSWPFQDL